MDVSLSKEVKQITFMQPIDNQYVNIFWADSPKNLASLTSFYNKSETLRRFLFPA